MARRSLISGALALAALCATGTESSTAEAEETTPPPNVGGVVRPASPPGEGARRVADALVFLPRNLVSLVVVASSATAAFFEDQQVVPRARAVLGSQDGSLRWTPTLSLASGYRPDVGARVTAQRNDFASTLRMSIVDFDYYVMESRLLRSLGEKGHTQLVLEGYQQRRSGLGFGGVGRDRVTDPRNAFLPGREGMEGVFLESRQRLIAAVASRVADDYELLFSSSFQRRRIEDSPGRADTIATTFVPGTVAGAYDRSERTYTEFAVRRDTRAARGPPAAGLLLEGYAGASQDVHGTYAPAIHAGGRVAWFISVVRKTTIISPRVTLDVVGPVGHRGLPFREYAYASGFRGSSDGRVDHVAALASLDYRWQLRTNVATRLFVDITNVAPAVNALSAEHLAWAVGAWIDLHSQTTEIGRLGFSYSRDAIQLVLAFGLSDPGFGDRQHR